MTVLRKLWDGWKRIAHKIARFNSIVLTTILYVIVLPWVAVPFRLRKDPLRIRGRAGFVPRLRKQADMDEAARQG